MIFIGTEQAQQSFSRRFGQFRRIRFNHQQQRMQVLGKGFFIIAAVFLKRRIGSNQFGGVGINA